MRRMLADVTVFAMQSEEDARRIIALGAPPERVVVTGNLKRDRCPPRTAGSGLARAARPRGRAPVWIAGSTHRGEEEAVLDASSARGPCPGLVLLLAPRHPERAAR